MSIAYRCGPCRAISPHFERLAEADTSGKVKFYKVDVDAAPVRIFLYSGSFIFLQDVHPWGSGCITYINKLTEVAPCVDHQDIAAECGVTAMPTFLAFSKGNAIQTVKGADAAKLVVSPNCSRFAKYVVWALHPVNLHSENGHGLRWCMSISQRDWTPLDEKMFYDQSTIQSLSREQAHSILYLPLDHLWTWVNCDSDCITDI